MLLTCAETIYVSSYGNNFFVGLSQCITFALIFISQGKYLRNFHNEIIVRWNNACIYGLIVCYLVSWLLYIPEIKDILKHPSGSNGILYTLFALFSAALFLFYLICIAALGYNMRKIENDFVGGLKDLGNSYLYILPVTYLTIAIASVVKALADDISVTLLLTAISSIPFFKLILVFIKARTYSKKMANINSEIEP